MEEDKEKWGQAAWFQTGARFRQTGAKGAIADREYGGGQDRQLTYSQKKRTEDEGQTNEAVQTTWTHKQRWSTKRLDSQGPGSRQTRFTQTLLERLAADRNKAGPLNELVVERNAVLYRMNSQRQSQEKTIDIISIYIFD